MEWKRRLGGVRCAAMGTAYIYECTYCIWSERHKRNDLKLKCPVCGSDMEVVAEAEE